MTLRVFVALHFLCVHSAELVLDDHSASWDAAGLGSRFAAMYEKVLPAALLAELQKAAPRLANPRTLTPSGGSVEHSWWMPILNVDGKRSTPQSAIEAAVLLLFDLVFRGRTDHHVAGAEWWVRDQKETAEMNFHFDKDETTYHNEGTMRFPEVGTVTYLSGTGSPTLVLNQSMGFGADAMEPPLASEALLMQPQQNSLVIFRGNLHHGVVPQLSSRRTGTRRQVLLVNWWRAPAPTGFWCISPDEARWRALGHLQTAAYLDALALRTATEGETRAAVPSPFLSDVVSKDRRWVVLEVGDGHLYHYAFPPAPALGSGGWLIRWRGAAVGPITKMASNNVQSIIREPRPKLLLVLDGRSHLWQNRLPLWLPRLQERFAAQVRFVLAGPEDVGVLRAYGLKPEQAPTAVWHDTRNNVKRKLEERLSEATVTQLVVSSLPAESAAPAATADTPQPPPTPPTPPTSPAPPAPPTSPQSPSATCDAFKVPVILQLPDIPAALRSGDALRETEWQTLGAQHHASGRIELAVQYLVMATHTVSWGGPLWGNLGLALTDAAARATPEDRMPLLCEAWIAIELGTALGADPGAAGLDDTLAALGAAAGCGESPPADPKAQLLACAEAACAEWVGSATRERFSAARIAVALSQEESDDSHRRHLRAVERLCAPATPERVTVHLRPFEHSRQALSAVSAYQAWAIFRVCGVVAMADALGQHVVERTRETIRRKLDDSMPAIERYREERRRDAAKPHRKPHLEEESLASRDQSGLDLRYELKLNETDVHALVGDGEIALASGDEAAVGKGEGAENGERGRAGHTSTAPDATASDATLAGGFRGGVVDHELLLAITKLLLHGNALVVDTLSAVISLPRCLSGHWHADLDDPRDAAAALVGDSRPAPPPGLVAVVPLVNLTRRSGPTEFLLGSHVKGPVGEQDWWGARQTAGDPRVTQLELVLTAEEGTVVLFDMRMRHRGGANRSPEPRPILYVGYVMRWFRDAVNFKDTHTAVWDALPSRTQRVLLARLDTSAYTRRLEGELRARGVDLAQLQSRLAADYLVKDLVV